MDDDRPAPDGSDPSRPGPLTREAAVGLLARADDLLHAGDFQGAAAHYARVVGFDDPAVTAAALLGLGEARYRLDDEDGAVASWEAVVQLGETPSTYRAWRNLAASSVRVGALSAAMRAYREADRRAPAEDKAEIATRLGWLAKETGDSGSAKRYFARGRGDGPLIPLSIVVIVATVIVSLVAMLTTEGSSLTDALMLDKPAVAAGEYWRLWTVTLVHADPLHLFFNMYALYLVGPIVERWYGSLRFLVFYLACAAAGSAASFVFGAAPFAVGASGAIFGLFGIVFAAGRVHHPVDHASRAIMSQLLFLIVINIGFGFAVGGIDNAAHLGGLFAGLWLGGLIPPSGVPTLATMWMRPATGPRPTSVGAAALASAVPPAARRVTAPRALDWIGVGVIAIVVIVAVLIGTPTWLGVQIGGLAGSASLALPAPLLAGLVSGASAAWASSPLASTAATIAR